MYSLLQLLFYSPCELFFLVSGPSTTVPKSIHWLDESFSSHVREAVHIGPHLVEVVQIEFTQDGTLFIRALGNDITPGIHNHGVPESELRILCLVTTLCGSYHITLIFDSTSA